MLWTAILVACVAIGINLWQQTRRRAARELVTRLRTAETLQVPRILQEMGDADTLSDQILKMTTEDPQIDLWRRHLVQWVVMAQHRNPQVGETVRDKIVDALLDETLALDERLALRESLPPPAYVPLRFRLRSQ